MNKIFAASAISVLLLFPVVLVWAGPAPSATFKTADNAISLKDLRGQVVYLDFWASWCVPCRESFPWMNKMHERYGNKGLKVIAVNLDKEKGIVKKFLDKYPAKFTIAYDPEGTIAESYGVSAMPSSYLIDRAGNLVATHAGFRASDTADLEAKIRGELAK